MSSERLSSYWMDGILALMCLQKLYFSIIGWSIWVLLTDSGVKFNKSVHFTKWFVCFWTNEINCSNCIHPMKGTKCEEKKQWLEKVLGRVCDSQQ